MSFVPVTHFFPWSWINEKYRPYAMHELADAGIRNIVLTANLVGEILHNVRLGSVLKREAADAGLTFVDGHAPFADAECPAYPVEEERPLMLSRLELMLQIAADFGVKTFTIHTGNNFNRELPLQVYKDSLFRSFEVLLPRAEKLGVVMALENIWTTPNTPEVLLEVAGKFPSPYLGLCYDSGHANLMDKGRQKKDSPPALWWQTFEEIPWDDHILEKMLPHVVNCHLHDNDGFSDQHLVPGKGNIDWEHVMGLLRKAPRLQCIQNESSYYTDKDFTLRRVVKCFDDLCR